ncbi:TetR/AcrR family transcriptional regulator [Caulobacter hibisci]|uniref:TetR/AcrR family transcriptional regulator n=1 Tax=Caulobacter hibisci TaxID=2035993 RepID=A0ABS0SSW0_9CAUL|nr:TetR family transcriptional regulator [Caulobacter hibisci]MBI1682745.1 TetR/AcrR family transcriptional regulator [Caulobacter hibisci]
MAVLDLDSAAQLAEAGFRIALEDGLGAVTARTAAARAGAAASAVNYHFGDRGGFLRRIQALAVAHAADQRAALRLDRGPRWASLADRLTLLVAERLETGRLGLVLLGEFEIEAEVGGDAELRAGAGEGSLAEFAFWRETALALGAPQEAADGWAGLASGLLGLLHVEPDAGERLLWLAPAFRRLGARLSRAEIEPCPAGPAPDEVLPERAHANDTARRIVEAAIAGIAERGVHRLTQRDVAARAGVSLAATTYFFRTKADLVEAAMVELHRQVRAEVLASADAGVAGVASVMAPAGGFSERVRALGALQLAAAREPTLLPLAAAVRATRGATSMRMLRRQGVNDADGLDAMVWSTLMGGLISTHRFGDPDRRDAAFTAQGDLLRARIFGL